MKASATNVQPPLNMVMQIGEYGEGSDIDMITYNNVDVTVRGTSDYWNIYNLCVAGGYNRTTSGYTTRAMKLKMFCIRAYFKKLTPVEIAANYAVDKARFNLT